MKNVAKHPILATVCLTIIFLYSILLFNFMEPLEYITQKVADTPVLVDNTVPNLISKPFILIVTEFETIEDLHEAWFRINGDYPVSTLMAFMQRKDQGDNNIWCKVYITKITTVDDQILFDLGHEVNHCLSGSFHPLEFLSNRGKTE